MMINTTLKKVATSKLLVTLFLLLATILIVEFIFERYKLSETKNEITLLTNQSIKRQNLLVKIRKGCDFVQVNLLVYLFGNDPIKANYVFKIMRDEIDSNTHNLNNFKVLIHDSSEKKIYQNVLKLRKLNSHIRENIISLRKLKQDQNVKLKAIELFKSYDSFQNSVGILSEYVSSRDSKEIENVRTLFFDYEKIALYIKIIIFLLLGLTGTLILKLITKIKRAYLKISKSEQAYKQLIERTTEIIETLDNNGKFIAVNDTFKKKLEYSDIEITNLTIQDILAPESQHLYKPFPKKEEFGELITGIKKTLITKSGNKLWVEGNVVLHFNEEILESSTAYYTDITDRILAEQSLIASERRYKKLFNTSPIPKWTIDLNSYKPLYINEAAIRLYGYSKAEFLNLSFEKIVIENFNLNQCISTLKEKGKSLKIEQKHRKKNGEIIDMMLVFHLFEDSQEQYLMVIGNDITERNLYLNSLKDQNEKLKEIAWIQSHIVRSPLARMMGLIYLIEQEDTSFEEKNQMLQLVLLSAKELDIIIKDIVTKAQQITILS